MVEQGRFLLKHHVAVDDIVLADYGVAYVPGRMFSHNLIIPPRAVLQAASGMSEEPVPIEIRFEILARALVDHINQEMQESYGWV